MNRGIGMRPKNRIVAERKLYFRPEISCCPHCESKLIRAHASWKKKIATLQGVIQVSNMAYRCSNPHCSHLQARYRSAEAEKLCMKFTTYGFDVLCLVGELRFKHHRTRQEIADELQARGVKTSDRNAQMLYERYLALLSASLDDHIRTELQLVSQQNGGLLLSMDGVQPEKGNETLYVIREVNSGTVLVAKNVKSSSSQELQQLIQPIIELGYPIIGIVSDGQQSIRLAFETLLPDVPYQYCQYHYLKDIAKPVVDCDRKLKTELKKNLRGIRDVERKLEAHPTEETEIAQQYIAATRSLLLEDGNPPLDLPGMRIYQNAIAIQASLTRCLDQKKGDLYFKKL
jgi:hypothetical protein